MPEIKNIFTSGKMNKDLDERLVPKGEYLEATNIKVVSSEGSDVGSIKNIKGNVEVSKSEIASGNIIGKIVDTENDKIIYFVRGGAPASGVPSSGIDSILEYDPVNNTTVPVLTDIYKTLAPSSTVSGEVLKFDNNKPITGINILNGILFWTDGYNEPKKINIETMKNGLIDSISITATTAYATGGQSNKLPITTSNYGFGFSKMPYESGTADVTNPTYLDLKVRKANNSIVTPNFVHCRETDSWDKIYFPTGANGADLVDSGDEIIITLTQQKHKFQQHTHYIVDGVNKGLVTESDITVARPNPLNAPSMSLFNTDRAQTVTNLSCTTPADTPNSGFGFVDNTMTPQNHTFWTYKDVSGIIREKPPGTHVYGNATNIQDDNGKNVRIGYVTIGTGVTGLEIGDTVILKSTSTVTGDDLEIKLKLIINYGLADTPPGFDSTGLDANNSWETSIISMSSSMTDDLNANADIVWSVSLEQPDAMYQDDFVRFAYRWKYIDNEYSTFSPFTEPAFLTREQAYSFNAEEANNENMVNDVRRILFEEFDKAPIDVKEIDIIFKNSNETSVYVYDTIKIQDFPGFLDIKKESTKSLIEEKQLLRHYDNVPRIALAQDVVGNRIVYGNYKQQYDIINKTTIDLEHVSESIDPQYPKKSIKSLRDYQLGIVYLDEKNRQTPILTNKNAVVKIDQRHSDKKNSFKANITSSHPDWATHYKYFVKEPSSEYQNLTLDRFYINDEEDTCWLSFASSDVNKVQIDDYLILKKAHGSSIAVNNSSGKTVKYKVLAKQPEAPDFIKPRRKLFGTITTQFGYSPGYEQGFPVKNAGYVSILGNDIADSILKDIHTMSNTEGANYIRISSAGGFASKFYEVVNVEAVDGDGDGTFNQGGAGDHYKVSIKGSFGEDVNFTGSAGNKTSGLQFEFFTSKTDEIASEFEGRFFVKIASDDVFQDTVAHFIGTDEDKFTIVNTQILKHILSTQADLEANGETGTTDSTSKPVDFWPDHLNHIVARGDQDWGVDYGFSYNRTHKSGNTVLPNYTLADQGEGIQDGSKIMQFRFFGGKNRGIFYHSTNGYGANYPLPQSDFHPNTYDFYNQIARVGTSFKFAGSETIYTTELVTREVLENYPNVTGNHSGSGPHAGANTFESERFTLVVNSNDSTGVIPADPIVTQNIPHLCVDFSATAYPDSVGVQIQILESTKLDESFHSENPAVFEVQPKERIDLNLYYETSKSVMIPKVGMKIYSTNANFNDTTITAISNSGRQITIANATDAVVIPQGTEIIIENNHLNVDNLNNTRNRIQRFTLATEAAASSTVLTINKDDIKWYNCISFGNGVESNRIRDDFNANFIDKGPKVSTVLDVPYQEENRSSGMIYSGIYNAKSSFNESNQFITAEKITKDINPSYGSIQKLYTRNTDLIVFCEDKTLKVLANKDALFNADGNVNLTSTNKVLGQTIPFSGEYGISKDPNSFAKFGNRCYYTDRNRGAVIRLSRDGITNIAQKGMTSYFKEKLHQTTSILGSYDKDSDLYNVTLKFSNSSDDTTVSFTEKTNGWTSFKSFVPQAACSLNGVYYTGYNGNIWKHSADAGASNTFYGNFVESSVKFVINDDPSSIKEFKTLNYEGSNSRLYSSTIGSESSLETDLFLTSNDGKGWYVDTIKTNESSGYVPEFEEKEGKWFNNIKGIDNTEDNIDLQQNNVQGLSSPGYFIKSTGVSLASVYSTSYTNIVCVGGTGVVGVNIRGPENETWWWNSKYAFILSKGSSNQVVWTTPGFANATYSTVSASTPSAGIKQISFNSQPVSEEGYYKFYVKEKYTGRVFESSAVHIIASQPLVATGAMHQPCSAGTSDDGVIRITPSLGSASYSNAKISVNADMSNPITDSSLSGSAPSQYFEFTGLTDTTYYYTVTDASGSCGPTTTAIQSLVVTRNPPITLLISTDNAAVCNIQDPFSSVGSNLSKNGATVTLTASGGSGNFQFSNDPQLATNNHIGATWSNSTTSTTYTFVVNTPSTNYFSVRDTNQHSNNISGQQFDQPDNTTKLAHSVTATDASNQAGNNGAAEFIVTGVSGNSVQVVVKRLTGGNFNGSGSLTSTTVATLNLNNDGSGTWSGAANGLVGTAPNIFSSPITIEETYVYEVTDGSGCRADAPIGSAFATGAGAGTFMIGNSYNVVMAPMKTWGRVYFDAVDSNNLLGFYGGAYPIAQGGGYPFDVTLVAGNQYSHFYTTNQNALYGAKFKHAFKWNNVVPELSTYDQNVHMYTITSNGNYVVDAADFSAVTSGWGPLLGDGEFTLPAISSPGAIEDTAGNNPIPNIVFANTQALDGTANDQNNTVTVTVPFNFTMPVQPGQKIIFGIVGSAYQNSTVI